MSVILASGSPRRKELLEMLEVKDMKIIPAKGEECPVEGAGPEETVRALSRQKAAEVAAAAQDGDIIIAADTIVWFNGRIFGKPHSEAEAKRMLSELSGCTHQVYTGVTVMERKDSKWEKITFAECTDVSFYSVSEEEIRAYVATGEPMDKAGSYGIQGGFGAYVKGIRGDYTNVVGLPVGRLFYETKKHGIELRG